MADPQQATQIYRAILARTPENQIDPTLDRVRRALDLLGQPERTCQVVHVAGTNGKTSTARLIEALVRAHGLRTGLFISPHLASPAERILLDGEPISDEALIEAWRLVGPVVDMVDTEMAGVSKGKLSFFEVMWLVAAVAMADAPVDVAVVEVGLGGRWDATNTVESQVQVITPISRDHTEYLGDSIEAIAREKAGIIRSEVVLGRQSDAAAGVLEAAIDSSGARGHWLGQDFDVVARELAVGGQLVHLRGLAWPYEQVFLPLHGAHQADNAACAVAAVELLLAGAGTGLDSEVLAEALAETASPGRLEVVGVAPTVLVDAAHNHAGAEALAAAIDEAFPFDLIGLVGVLRGKDAEAILGALEPVVQRVVVTEAASDRAVPAAELAEVALEVFGPDRVEVVEYLDEALTRAVELALIDADGSPAPLATGVLATGSVILAGQVRTLLGGAPRHGVS